MKLKKKALSVFISGTILFGVCTGLAYAGARLTLGYLYNKAAVNNADPDLGDGKYTYTDTDFTVQGNFGIMVEPSETTRFGVRYLTETYLDFEDNLYTSGMGPGIANATRSIGKIDLGLKMPQSVMVGAYHRLNHQWAILGSVG